MSRCSLLLLATSLVAGCVADDLPAGPRDGSFTRVDAALPPDAAQHDVDAGPTCASELVACDGTCVDTRRDFMNCGACGTTCATDEVCTASACSREGCPTGTMSCGGSCLDTTADEMNCGACGNACGASETCEASACVGCGTGISFAGDVQPIFIGGCLGAACHGGMRPAGGMSLESGRAYAELVNVASSCPDGRALVAPGDPDESYLVHKITGTRICTGNRMPLTGAALTTAQIETIRGWICGGARND